MALEPITRQEKIIAGQDLTHITRMEMFLKEYGGGGGEQPVLFAKATLDDPEWDGASATTISIDKTFDEIDSAFQSGKYVFVEFGDLGIPELMQLKRSGSNKYYFGTIVGRNQWRLLNFSLGYFGDKWSIVPEQPTVHDVSVVGLYIYGEDSRMYKISVNNGTLSATAV